MRVAQVLAGTGLAAALGLGGVAASSAFGATKSATSHVSGTSGASGTSGQSSARPAPRPRGPRPSAVGKVASVDVSANTFTLTTDSGTVTVDVTSATTYRDYEVSSPSLSNVTVGTEVAVFGTSTNGVIAATSVAIDVPPPPPGGPDHERPSAVGKVASVDASANTFTLTTDSGTVTVDVTSATTYRDHDVTSPSLANVTVGEEVAVFGTSTNGTLDATSVCIGVPSGPPNGPGDGPGREGFGPRTPPSGSSTNS
jgi:hypothetical protein